MSTLAVNRRALHDYTIISHLEAGLVLTGAEVKSAKLGQCSLAGSFVKIDPRGEAWLVNATITRYPPAHLQAYDPQHTRKLLLHEKELDKLIGLDGLTIVPLKLYTTGKSQRIKLEIAVARGKKKYEKRAAIKKRETDREIRQATRL